MDTKLQHRITNVNEQTELADCLVCGPDTKVLWKKQGGWSWRCRNKANQDTRESYQRNKDKRKKRSRNYYYFSDGTRWSVAEKREMIAVQDNKCAICSNAFKDARDTHLDHCHETKKLRGVLCKMCNNGLGNYLDNPDLLRSAANYLEQTS